uniref:Uncharacterized protein n=1 Tax=Aegilops tauschii subsp. strangulata TaxID=200361 RepID=A0A453GQV7_AEGTS
EMLTHNLNSSASFFNSRHWGSAPLQLSVYCMGTVACTIGRQF